MQAIIHAGEVLLVREAREEQRHVSKHVAGKRLPPHKSHTKVTLDGAQDLGWVRNLIGRYGIHKGSRRDLWVAYLVHEFEAQHAPYPLEGTSHLLHHHHHHHTSWLQHSIRRLLQHGPWTDKKA